MLVFHGGPGEFVRGASCRRFRTPEVFQAEFFDQRGCGRFDAGKGETMHFTAAVLANGAARTLDFFADQAKVDTARRFMGIDAGAAVCRKVSRTGQGCCCCQKNFFPCRRNAGPTRRADEISGGLSRYNGRIAASYAVQCPFAAVLCRSGQFA